MIQFVFIVLNMLNVYIVSVCLSVMFHVPNHLTGSDYVCMIGTRLEVLKTNLCFISAHSLCNVGSAWNSQTRRERWNIASVSFYQDLPNVVAEWF
jgi:hypothetical protein